VGGWRRL